jgi:hypothetical protein
MPKRKTLTNFQINIFVSDRELSQFCPQKSKINLIMSTMHFGDTLMSTTIGMKLHHMNILNCVPNTRKLALKFECNILLILVCVLAEIPNIV